MKLIALDLDGTLLTTEKELTAENEAALRRAAEAGIEIVPATGRFYGAIPENVRSLPYLHYAITVNGAQIYDIREDRPLFRSEIPWRRAVEIMEYLDTLPVIYDCYMDNWGWMTRALYDRAADFAPHRHSLEMLQKMRPPRTGAQGASGRGRPRCPENSDVFPRYGAAGKGNGGHESTLSRFGRVELHTTERRAQQS